MIKNRKRKKQKRPLLLCMIVAGMKRPAMILAAAGFATAVRHRDRLKIKVGFGKSKGG
jgi:hypothetical protein